MTTIGKIVAFTLLLTNSWSFKTTPPSSFFRKGDIIIGLVLPLHSKNGTGFHNQLETSCGDLVASSVVALSHFVRVVDTVNAEKSLLGDLQIGFDVIDSCSSNNIALLQASDWGRDKILNLDTPIPFAISNGQNDITVALSMWLSQFGIPLIDFKSTAVELGDRYRYPTLARTVPSDKIKTQVIASIVANVVEWRHVNLVYSKGLYGESGAHALRQELAKLGIAVAGDFQAPSASSRNAAKSFINVANAFDRSIDVPGVICFCNEIDTVLLMRAMRQIAQRKSVSGSSSLLITSASFEEGYTFSANDLAPDGMLSVVTALPQTNAASWFLNNFPTILESQFDNPYLREFLAVLSSNNSSASSSIVPKCNPLGNCTIQLPPELLMSPEDVASGSLTNAIYAGLHTIAAMIEQFCRDDSFSSCKSRPQFRHLLQNGSLFYGHLRLVNFEAPFIIDDGEAHSTFAFDNNVDLPAMFKFVLFDEDASFPGGIASEEFGDYSHARKFINLICTELVSRMLFTDQHVDCKRPNSGKSQQFSLSHPTSLGSNPNGVDYSSPIFLVSITSSGLFLIICVIVIIYHFISFRKQASLRDVIVLRSSRQVDANNAIALQNLNI